jgi:hypothetical protein
MQEWKEEPCLVEAVERFITLLKMPEIDADYLKSLISMAYVFGEYRPNK